MNYNSFDNYSDLSLGFDCDDVAVVPQMGAVDDDAISNMMFGNGNGNGRSSLDLFEFGGISQAAEAKFESDPFAPLGLADIDFDVPDVPAPVAPVAAPAMPALGEFNSFIPNSLPEFIMESDMDGESDMDAAVPAFPVRAKGVASPAKIAKTVTKRARSASHGYGRSAFAYADDWESDDGESDDEYVAPRRGRRVSRRPASRSVMGAEEADNLTREERVARWLAKKKTRVFKKTVRYESRKSYADKRPRIKGRFVSPEEYQAYMSQQAAQVVPSC
jgi:hypothetical protein